jgi:hypothetical protein
VGLERESEAAVAPPATVETVASMPAAQGTVRGPPASLGRAGILALQRSAGNAAVAGLLARQTPPGSAAPAAPPASGTPAAPAAPAVKEGPLTAGEVAATGGEPTPEGGWAMKPTVDADLLILQSPTARASTRATERPAGHRWQAST